MLKVHLKLKLTDTRKKEISRKVGKKRAKAAKEYFATFALSHFTLRETFLYSFAGGMYSIVRVGYGIEILFSSNAFLIALIAALLEVPGPVFD